MIDEFKKNVFNYLTGNLPDQTGDNDEHIVSINEISKKIITDFLPNYKRFELKGLLKVPEKFGNYLILYGGYTDNVTETNPVANGWICILDDKCEPIKSFTEFKNGTKLRFIEKMIVDADGNFYVIDSERLIAVYNNPNISGRRFLMLNNFISSNLIYNDYYIILQKSYNFNYSVSKVEEMIKSPSTSNFIFIATIRNNSQEAGTHDSTLIISLKVNVGSSNEWKTQRSEKSGQYYASYTEFDGDDNYVYIILTEYSDGTSRKVKKIIGNSESISQVLIPYDQKGIFNDITNTCVFKNANTAYFILGDAYGQYIYKLDGSTITTIAKSSNEDSSQYFGCFKLSKNNNNIYVYKYENKSSNNKYQGILYFSELRNDELKFQKILTTDQVTDFSFFVISSNNYNLLTHYCIFTKFNSVYFNEIYNFNNYNGLPYINKDSLIANSSVIKSEEKPIFARNLYNKTINENTTISTVEIPNTYLNNITITSKELLSKTNLDLVKDNNALQKNIYETVYLNFINSINIIDNNNDSKLQNTSASIYLNQSINDDDSYDNTKLYNKIIINYQDETKKEISYELQKVNSISANIAFALYTDKKIQSAEIISNDKTTIYQTIDLSSLELFKNYKISQRLEVM